MAALALAACSSDAETSSAVTSSVVTSSVVTTSDSGATETAPADTGAVNTAVAPMAVETGQTSIVVESTADQYFVLFVRPDASSELELPVAVIRGEAGSTTLTDGRTHLPEEQYRVQTESIGEPGDVDGDGIDDLTELDSAGDNPLNPAPSMDPDTGAAIIADHETFQAFSYQGDDVARDAYLAGLEYVKFWITETDTDRPAVYFMNTEHYRAHPPFAEVVGIQAGRGPAPGKMRGDIVYAPDELAPDGSTGRYRFAFQPNDAYSFAEISLAYEALVNAMPTLAGKLFYEPYPQSALPRYEQERDQYDTSRVPVLLP
jgi:hypothetical protein